MTGAGQAPTPAIAAESVSKRYESVDETVTTALEGVTFSIDPGEFVTVVGPSGCGKTTLVRLVGGLDAPTGGRLLVGGEPVAGPDPSRAMVFQEYHLFPWLTVRENVAFGLVEQDVPEARRSERVRQMLSLVGLSNRADAYPAALSGGMKQRVGLARALAVDPDLLLMDEPFGSVDAQTRRRLQGELLEIWRSMDKTVLFVTHDIEEAVALGDRVLVIGGQPGRVRETVDVAIERPRERTDDEVVDAVDRILQLVEPTR